MNHQMNPAEQDCLALAAQGLPDKEIAHQRGCATRTVKSHLQAARIKLGARNTTHAVAIAIRDCLFDTDPLDS